MATYTASRLIVSGVLFVLASLIVPDGPFLRQFGALALAGWSALVFVHERKE